MGIVFERVEYSYPGGRNVERIGLNGVDLCLEEGRFIAVLGAPGSGKSTLMQHFNGLLRPQSGSVHLLDFVLRSGDKPKDLRGLRKKVGLVFQFPEQQLFEETVEKDLCFGPLCFGMKKEEAVLAARKTAARLGLDESLLTRSPWQLSSGQLRKAALATVLVSDPDVLVLDEPTASLDQFSRAELVQLLAGLCREEGKTIVLVTHRLEEVLGIADEYVVMHQGRAVLHGSEEVLLQQPKIIEDAGIILPASVRFAELLRQRFGVPLPSRYDAGTIAESIGSLFAGRETRQEARL